MLVIKVFPLSSHSLFCLLLCDVEIRTLQKKFLFAAWFPGLLYSKELLEGVEGRKKT